MIRVVFENKVKSSLVEIGTLCVGQFFITPSEPSNLKMIISKGADQKVYYLRMSCVGDQSYHYGDAVVIHIKDVDILVRDTVIFPY